MTKIVTSILTLALLMPLLPRAWAHDSAQDCQDQMGSQAVEVQRRLWRMEMTFHLQEAAVLRTQLASYYQSVPIRQFDLFTVKHYNSAPQIAQLADGGRGIYKSLLSGAEQSPKHEMAALIANEELGWPIRIPMLAWREDPRPGSLQLWFTPIRMAPGKSPIESDLFFFDFLIDNYDRVHANVLYDDEFGLVAIDHAAAFADITVMQDWSNMLNLKHNCVHPNLANRLQCMHKIFDQKRANVQLPWNEIMARLDVPRLLNRIEPWIDKRAFKRLIIRLCILKAYFSEGNNGSYPQCAPYFKDAGFTI